MVRLDASSVFAQVVHDVANGLTSRPMDQVSGSSISSSLDTRGQRESTGSTFTQANRGKAPARGQARESTSQKSTKAPAQSQELSKRARGKTATANDEAPGKPKKPKADCPIYKYHVMHGLEPRCRGCGGESMNAIRAHIKNSSVHLPFVNFLERCKRCTTNVVCSQGWVDGGHQAGTCTQRSEPHGSLIPSWVRLYLSIFPQETEVPNPGRFQMQRRRRVHA